MAIPLLLAVTLGLVWLLTLATAQVRMVDATPRSRPPSAANAGG